MWHGIDFKDIVEISSYKLPDSSFYNTFYKKFFGIYDGYDSLDSTWLSQKKGVASWIASSINKPSKILSVGCGLGYIEQYLHVGHSNVFEVHASDYAESALRWLRKTMPVEQIHTVSVESLEDTYDVIYLSGIEYAFSDNDLINLIEACKNKLNNNGKLILISVNLLDESVHRRLLRYIKDFIKFLLGMVGLYDIGQFWGWMRTKDEHRKIISAANFKSYEDGFILAGNRLIYQITARL